MTSKRDQLRAEITRSNEGVFGPASRGKREPRVEVPAELAPFDLDGALAANGYPPRPKRGGYERPYPWGDD